MKVAVLCEHSGVVRDAFRRRGHEAVSYDLLPSEQDGPHVQGDCREQDLSWADLVIAHPTCTRLCNSGVRWLAERNLWEQMREAAEFFLWCTQQGKKNGTENPIMHKYAREIVGRGPDQIIQPWMFGDGETKATGLWLRGIPPLSISAPLFTETKIVAGRIAACHLEPPGPDRWKVRSKTYQGIADAMAEQWGGLA